jgi:hypothetical protein
VAAVVGGVCTIVLVGSGVLLRRVVSKNAARKAMHNMQSNSFNESVL